MEKSVWLRTAEAGSIPNADRIQRLFIGGLLIALTLSSWHRADFRTYIALGLQADLFLTGLVGWCPVYWTCSITTAKGGSKTED